MTADLVVCSIEGCEKSGRLTRGWCGAHYSQWLRKGDPVHREPERIPYAALNEPARLAAIRSALDPHLARVSVTESGCWEWQSSRTSGGYGDLRVHGAHLRATRAVYEVTFGPLGKLYVCHACDNPPCVNPSHLFAGTPSQNVQDCVSKGRLRPGRTTGLASALATVPFESVQEARQLYESGDANQRELAKRYGVSQSTIWRWLRSDLRSVA